MRKIWDKFVSFISRVPYDKWLHFMAGLIVAAFFAITLKMTACIVPAIFAAFIKEFFDDWTTGEHDLWDLVATVSGGLLIQLFVILG